MISIYTLTSPLHDKSAVDAATKEFLDGLGIEYSLKGEDFDDYGTDLSLIYVRTGGTEGLLKELLPSLQGLSRQPILLLTSGKSNSLAASMEILSYLRRDGVRGEILHGDPEYIRTRIEAIETVESARRSMEYTTLGVIGEPSDWLIASEVDREAVFDKLGINLEYFTMEELMKEYSSLKDDISESWKEVAGGSSNALPTPVKQAIPGAWRLYKALKVLVDDYGLSGLTIRCFDLLTSVHNTGCVALARLNSEGIVAGCEGDIPAMISMMVGRAVTGVSGFQANPSAIDTRTGEVSFAHCTVPLDMVSDYGLDSHFESGIGVGVRGHIPEGPVTVFKVNGDVSRHFVCEGELVRNEARPDRCRTQVVVKLPPEAVSYFLKDPIGNHHIILPGHVGDTLNKILSF